MIFVKANRLQLNAGHTSVQLWQDLADIAADARIQDPAAVFTNPNYVVLKKVYAVSRLSVFHDGTIPLPGSFIHG
jgi:hypothetical protein